jgi:hypothetical protein
MAKIVKEKTGATTTLHGLIAELNAEHPKANGELIDSKALQRTLEFLRQSIGLTVKSSDETLPADTLKTIKLFYLADANSPKNVLRLLAHPDFIGKVTMEFSTVNTMPSDEAAYDLIDSLLRTLALDIAPDKLRMFAHLIGDQAPTTAESLLIHADRIFSEAAHILHRYGHSGDRASAGIYLALTSMIRPWNLEHTLKLNTPASESAYVYLQTLGFRHFLKHYREHTELFRLQGEIGDIGPESEQVLLLVRKEEDRTHRALDLIFSINTAALIIRRRPKQLAALIAKATTIPTSARQVISNLNRAVVLLRSHAYRLFSGAGENEEILSLYDIVAALSSIRYQQQKKKEKKKEKKKKDEDKDDSKYKPYWHGQTDQGSDPQAMLDQVVATNNPQLFQGVIQLYLNRFYEYRASFTGIRQSHEAQMQYHAALLDAYQRVIDIGDIEELSDGLSILSTLCTNVTRRIVARPEAWNSKLLHPITYSYGDGSPTDPQGTGREQ